MPKALLLGTQILLLSGLIKQNQRREEGMETDKKNSTEQRGKELGSYKGRVKCAPKLSAG